MVEIEEIEFNYSFAKDLLSCSIRCSKIRAEIKLIDSNGRVRHRRWRESTTSNQRQDFIDYINKIMKKVK